MPKTSEALPSLTRPFLRPRPSVFRGQSDERDVCKQGPTLSTASIAEDGSYGRRGVPLVAPPTGSISGLEARSTSSRLSCDSSCIGQEALSPVLYSRVLSPVVTLSESYHIWLSDDMRRDAVPCLTLSHSVQHKRLRPQ